MTPENKNADLLGVVASDLPKSEVIATLTKRVMETETNTEKYGWKLYGKFNKGIKFDGTKDYNYVEYGTTDSTNPYADTTIEDFNGETNKVLRETIEASKQSNVKTKMLDSQLHNFRTNAKDAVSLVFQNTENINKKQGVVLEQATWNVLNAGKYVIDVSTAADDIEVNKVIYQTLIEGETTSKAHPYVGNGGDGSITIDGETINPSMQFNSNEYIMVSSPEFATNTVFNGERSFFNWNGKQLELNSVMTLDLAKYEGIANPAKTDLANFKAILIHKDAFDIIMDWEGQKIANGPKLYQVMHNYMKYEVYKRLDRPVIVFDATVTPTSTKETK